MLYSLLGNRDLKMSDQVMMNTELWPYGLKVMVVEGNPQYLRLMDQLLSQCNYNVIPFSDIQEALSYAVDNQHTIDLVFSDVFLPNEGGLLILKTINLHLDIPIIMTSWCGDTSLVMKYISYGACDFLIKPLTLKEVKNAWHHVYRKKVRDCMNEGNRFDLNAMLIDDSNQKGCSYLPMLANEDDKTVDDVRELKKSRLHWNRQLHNQFISALETLGGVDKAVPRKILEIMRVRELTREHVASHLQKYRFHLKKLAAHNGSKPPAPPQPTSPTEGGLETEAEPKEILKFNKGETSEEGDSFFSELVEEFSGKHHNSSSSSSY